MSDAVRNTRELCLSLLPEVSRTFALTIPELPEPLRVSVGCSYLLCRISDNIEDHPGLDDRLREKLFDLFLGSLEGESCDEFIQSWPPGPGRDLAENLPGILVALQSLPESHRGPINTCVRDMIAGMRKMILHREPSRKFHVCHSLEELEEYCHYVAGTVGIMLHGIFTDFTGTACDEKNREAARRLGLGLQLTNILQDRRVDASRGISFLPPDSPDPVFLRALTRLQEGHEYTLSLPPELRLFCLWALWMAVATLEEVAQSTETRPKIDRGRVTEILTFTRTHLQETGILARRFNADLARTRDRLSGSELVK